MGNKTLGIVVLMVCYNAVACEESAVQYDETRTTTKHSAHHQCATCNEKTNDKDIAEKAIATLASMATSILNIGSDAHNPAVIGTAVINILSSFVNFVTFAIKNPGVAELLNDEAFQEVLRSCIAKNLAERQPEMVDAVL